MRNNKLECLFLETFPPSQPSLIFAGVAGACPSEPPFRYPLGLAPGLTRKILGLAEILEIDKRSILTVLFFRDYEYTL